ncbi:MAG: exodeoxyribonuclease V subunit gamma, partial [Bacteroidetes bacterium]|nr:exodeoxyribonuclease V subunit gamma [Bacteroidota bacterium]
HLVQVSWSSKETKYLIRSYILYLAGAASGQLSGLSFISGGSKKQLYRAVPLSRKEAMDRLTGLLKIYKAGFAYPACFFPDFEITPEKIETLNEDQFAARVESTLNNTMYPTRDKHILAEYRNGFFRRPEALEEYRDVCRQVLAPLIEFFPGYFKAATT